MKRLVLIAITAVLAATAGAALAASHQVVFSNYILHAGDVTIIQGTGLACSASRISGQLGYDCYVPKRIGSSYQVFYTAKKVEIVGGGRIVFSRRQP